MSGFLEKQDTTQTFSTNHDKGQLYRYLVGHNQDQDGQNIPETDPQVVIRGSESCFSAMVATSVMTSTFCVERIGGAATSVSSRPVAQPPRKTSRSTSSSRCWTTASKISRLGFVIRCILFQPYSQFLRGNFLLSGSTATNHIHQC